MAGGPVIDRPRAATTSRIVSRSLPTDGSGASDFTTIRDPDCAGSASKPGGRSNYLPNPAFRSASAIEPGRRCGRLSAAAASTLGRGHRLGCLARRGSPLALGRSPLLPTARASVPSPAAPHLVVESQTSARCVGER